MHCCSEKSYQMEENQSIRRIHTGKHKRLWVDQIKNQHPLSDGKIFIYFYIHVTCNRCCNVEIGTRGKWIPVEVAFGSSTCKSKALSFSWQWHFKWSLMTTIIKFLKILLFSLNGVLLARRLFRTVNDDAMQSTSDQCVCLKFWWMSVFLIAKLLVPKVTKYVKSMSNH